MKTNIGISGGRIVGIGRAGNPDITAGVDMTIGPNTLPIMGYGLIATAGAVDSHVHLKHGDAAKTEYSAEVIVDVMNRAGIDKSIVFAMSTTTRRSPEP